MTTPEQPANPPLTRKKMREIRNTGSTPIVTPVGDETDVTPHADAVTDAAPTPEHPAEHDEAHKGAENNDPHTASEEPGATAPPVVSEVPTAFAPLPRAATPVDVGPRPVADASVDLGVTPLTRRQARQQERIRTASVPVITPDVAAAAREHEPVHAGSASGSDGFRALFGTGPSPVAAPVFEPDDFAPSADDTVAQENEGWRDVVLEATPQTAAPAAGLVGDGQAEDPTADADPVDGDHTDAEHEDAAADEEEPARAVVNPALGASLLSADATETDLPSSFDQILARSTGAVSTSNTLIMADATPGDFGGAVASTGEVILTGTIQLPEGLGSTGHARGTTDGKDVDAVLVDGELPAHSSPTPIAASAAISTVKTAGEVIKPPVPEKGSRLMMSLAITAGVLALALVGVLIVAFATGVFS